MHGKAGATGGVGVLAGDLGAGETARLWHGSMVETCQANDAIDGGEVTHGGRGG